MKKAPTISVLMTAYNSQQYVAEAIESILGQTFGDFEFIIINDGSTDDTAKIIRKYARADKRIRFIDNKKNQGLIAVLNQGLDLCTGQYIARMDSDDISMPHRFARQIEYMTQHPDVGILGTWIQITPPQGRPDAGKHKENIGYMDILGGWVVNHPTVMMRTDVMRKNNLYYRPEFPHAEDYDMWARAIRFTKIRNIQEELLKYRIHGNNISSVQHAAAKESIEHTRQEMLEFMTDDVKMQKKLMAMVSDKRVFEIKVFGRTLIKISVHKHKRRHA